MNNNNNQIGALWAQKSSAGNTYLSGIIELNGEKIRIVAFKNTRKEAGSKQPDFTVRLSEPMTRKPLVPDEEVIERSGPVHEESTPLPTDEDAPPFV